MLGVAMNERETFMTEAEVKNLRQVKQREALSSEEDDANLKWVLSTERGRAFLWKELSDCGVFALSFSQHNGAMSFNEGQRNVGLRLYSNICRVDVEAYFLMQRENQKKVEEEK